MSRIVITSAGTLGDHLPYIALGKALQERGHQVVCAMGESILPYGERAGLTLIPCGYGVTPAIAQKNAQDWDELAGVNRFKQISSDTPQLQEQLLTQELDHVLETLLPLGETADLLICGYQRNLAGQFTAEKQQLPWVSTSVMPYALEFLPSPQSPGESDFSLVLINRIRQKYALAPLLSASDNPSPNPRAMLAASPHFSPPHFSAFPYEQVGFWFYEDPAWSHWQPDSVLEQFMASAPQPLVLTFSSLPLQDAATVLNLHGRAAMHLGYKLLVQKGWANFNESLLAPDIDRNAILFRDFLPQDWLFARASAVIHHGGIGTIARALRNDCPMVVEPYGNDQFFNAQQILRLKIGAAMHPQRMTAEGLAWVLENKVMTAACRQNVQMLGEKIRAEQGLEIACQRIESWL